MFIFGGTIVTIKRDVLPESEYMDQELFQEEQPTARRDYSRRVDRFMEPPAQQARMDVDWKQVLLGLLFVAIAIFFFQTALSSTFGWVGSSIYAVSGGLVVLGAVRFFLRGFRKS